MNILAKLRTMFNTSTRLIKLNKLANLFSIASIIGVTLFVIGDVHRVHAQAVQTNIEISRVTLQIKEKRLLMDVGSSQIECLAKNIFFEARDQSVAGQVAVAWVTLNRVNNARYPNTICGVVTQGMRDDSGNMLKNKCQFSWYCDGKPDVIAKAEVAQRAWEDAQTIAEVVVLDWIRGQVGTVHGATMYHATYVNPRWANEFKVVMRIDDHIFYR